MLAESAHSDADRGPRRNPLVDVHDELAKAVCEAYGMGKAENPLAFLLKLNSDLAAREASGESVVGPGFSFGVAARADLVTSDRMIP